jgi:tRNA A-37 threonylcarbamoyl transferase component Bud32
MTDETVIDAQLESLDEAMDAARMCEVLEPVAGALCGRRVAIRSLQVEVVRQRLKRCVLRYRAELADGTPLCLFGKVFRPGFGEPIYEKSRALWKRGFSRDAEDGVHVPEALAFVPELSLLILEEVPGQPFKARLVETGSEALIRRMARLLVKLHSVRPWPGPAFRMPSHVARCHPAVPALGAALPDLAADVDSILGCARAFDEKLDDDSFAAIHGDLHPSQVLMEGEHSYLIDLDSLALGDPAADLGNLLVFLRSNSRLPGLPRLLDAFLDEYAAAMDARILERVPVYEAVTHVRRACKDLRFGKPGWQVKARQRVAEGLHCLDSL